MIHGVGLDLVEIDRLREILDRNGPAFLERILHPDEDRARFDKPDAAAHLAGVFAAKEAVMKALGTGMAGAAFKDIRIAHHDTGQPHVLLDGEAAARAAAMGVTGWQLSITHSKSAAAAVALALG